MCEVYILLAFALGLFSGWLANFLLSGKYIEKALDSYYSEDEKKQIKETVHAEHRKFKISTALWITVLFLVFIVIIYMLSVSGAHGQISSDGAKAIENADNSRVFNTLIDSMKGFSR